MIPTSRTAVLLSTVTLFAQVAFGLPTTSGPERRNNARAVGQISDRNESSTLREAPESESDLQSRLDGIWASTTGSNGADTFWDKVVRQAHQNILPGQGIDINYIDEPDTITNALVGPLDPRDSFSNLNNPDVPGDHYPRSSDADPYFTIPEEALRAAIYLPPGFTTSSNRQVVLFVPGTGSYGHEAFGPNLLKVITSSGAADTVWLNVPAAMLNDAQTNAEFIAYAISYVKALIGEDRELNVIGWSQGNLATQWVFTYWLSTVPKVRQLISVSPNFHGTVLANGLCLNAGNLTNDIKEGLPCPPSVLQQEYNSNLVSTLRAAGGGDAYVPTTSFWSSFFDEIVQPQIGLTASARIGDARKKGVTNVEVQTVCGVSPGGGFYGHSSLLSHPLVAALTLDALRNGGPASLERIESEIHDICQNIVAPGLELADGIKTAGDIVLAAVRLIAYPAKLKEEPVLRAYAV
ncbi:hypothetical protein N0V85_003488 [Neurospora sp. IMI 360204]|nr:hypothetical protein N0V85_003488 [Neurospora sp. IMI 360204]